MNDELRVKIRKKLASRDGGCDARIVKKGKKGGISYRVLSIAYGG